MSDQKNFLEYFKKLPGKLSEDEMENTFSVECKYTEGYVKGIEEVTASATNWIVHSAPYLEALNWFEAMRNHTSDEEATAVFAALPSLQKTIVQRGYQIRYEDSYAPMLDGGLYRIGLSWDDSYSLNLFPVSRVVDENGNPTFVDAEHLTYEQWVIENADHEQGVSDGTHTPYLH